MHDMANIRIIYTQHPKFEHNGHEYYTKTSMFKDFSAWQYEIDKMIEKHGVKTCFIHSILNVGAEDELIKMVGGVIPPLFIRYCFIPPAKDNIDNIPPSEDKNKTILDWLRNGK